MRSNKSATLSPTPAVDQHAAEAILLPRWPMIVITVLYLVLGAAYNHFVPYVSGAEAGQMIRAGSLATNPDEAAHVQNTLVYRSGHLPVFSESSSDFEAHQPPLYYLLAAPLVDPTPGSTRPADAVRWLSILLGAALVWVVFAVVREAFPARPYLAVGVAAFVGLLPTNLNLCASVNNDVLTNLVVAAGLWQLIRIARIAQVRDPKRLRISCLILGVVVGVGVLTKTSTLVLVPTIVVAAFVFWRTKLLSPRETGLFAVCSLGLGLLIGLPWMVRNTVLYGDPVAQHIFMTAFQNTMTTQRMLEQMSLGSYAVTVVRVTFKSFWAVFNSMQLFLPQPVYGVLAALGVVSGIGMARAWRSEAGGLVQRTALILCATLLVCSLVVFARFNMVFFQAQGRYLYTALAPFGLFFVMGLSNLVPRCSENDDSRIVVYITIGLLLLNGISFYFLSAL